MGRSLLLTCAQPLPPRQREGQCEGLKDWRRQPGRLGYCRLRRCDHRHVLKILNTALRASNKENPSQLRCVTMVSRHTTNL